MKFAFIGYDYTLDIALRLIENGHHCTHFFTFECDNVFSFNREMKTYAAHHKTPISETPITSNDIKAIISDDVTAIICAGYPHKIPPIDTDKAYGINVHPALLPQARGVMPLPYVITDARKAAGFTIHKLTPDFDAGDILYREEITITDADDIETLSARIAIALPNAVSQVVDDIAQYWNNATPQNHDDAKTYYTPDDAMRTLNLSQNVRELLLRGRAFGRFGCLVNITNKFGQSQKLAVYNFSGWEEAHKHDCGTLLRAGPREIILAAGDGYLCFKEFQVIV